MVAFAAENFAAAQSVPNPTQQTVATAQGEIPIFRVTVVGRTVPAINYRPRSGDTRINFAGTTLMPKAEGSASVEGEKGYIEIDAVVTLSRPSLPLTCSSPRFVARPSGVIAHST